MVFLNDVNFFNNKGKHKTQLDPNKEASLEVNAERTKYIFKSLEQISGQHQYKYSEQPSEILMVKYLETRVTNKIGIHTEIKSLLI